MPIKLYLGCALSEAPPEFRDLVAELKNILKAQKNPNGAPSYEVLEFLGLVAGTPGDVYTHDIINCVQKCDLMLAICDHPSTGLGWELCEAVSIRKIPVLGVARTEKKITRFLPGAAEHHKNFTIGRYNNMLEDVPRLLDQMCEEVAFSAVGRGRTHGGAVAGVDGD